MTPLLERRTASTITRTVALLVGIFTIIGTLVGAGITFGQHLHADTEQDRRLGIAEERLRVLEGIACGEHPAYCSTIYVYKEGK